MLLTPSTITFLLNAESKALATLSAEGMVNVVPVSSIRVEEDAVILVNYFMDKTLANILATGHVALVAWSKGIGYQIKGTVRYEASGAVFDRTVAWVATIFPDRTVKGVLIITPTELYDVAPVKNTAEVLEKVEKN
ncbi:MAG TPA: pyridoxamine 5'-phosphate oxidase family protein [Candidatus Paceibacterota bacterium]|nr:pyridoxamine 5'-phosphate oxidase family protein [Candidatus Paceibacterota bacterium]